MPKKIIILKKQIHKLSILLCAVLCLGFLTSVGQTLPISSLKDWYQKDSLLAKQTVDTNNVSADTLAISPFPTKDSIRMENSNGDLAATVFYKAEDSIMLDVPNKKAYLYGKAEIKYQNMQLNAEQIEIKWDQNIVKAKGKVDSTGRYTGRPVWKQGAEIIVTDSMRYNIETQKGIIHGIETKQGDGYLQGDTAKRTQEAIFLREGKYTTCNQKHPHFYIRARKLKVIPDDKAVCGPFHMVIEDIPTPIGFLMGYFPMMDKKKSGIIFPTFGENISRGLFFSKGGYYWAVNDYMGMELVGDVYANGSWLANLNNDYVKRYKYKGNLDIGVSRIKEGFDRQPNVPYQFKVQWAHTMIAKRNGTFTASVNVSSSRFNRQNSINPTTRASSNVTSSALTYRRVFGKSPFSTSISFRGTQNNSQSTALNNLPAQYQVTLPEASLTMNRINPFKKKYSDGAKWYEKVFLNYQGNFSYNFTNRQRYYNDFTRNLRDTTYAVTGENLNRYILPNGIWASNHQTSTGATFKLLKYLNFNPSINYVANLYGKKLIYAYNSTTKTSTAVDTISGLYMAHTANASFDINTRIYGTLQFKRNGLIKGFRHTLNPGVRMTLAPNFANIPSGGWTTVEGDFDKEGRPKKYFQYLGGQQTPNTRQAVLDVNIVNVLEAKVRNRKDTSATGKGYKKANILDNLSINGGYNFMADSLKMKNVTIAANTKLLNIFTIAFSSTYDPYLWVADSIAIINGRKTAIGNHRPTNTYLFDATGKLARLSVLDLSIGTTFSPKKGKQNATSTMKGNTLQQQAELDYIRNNAAQYVDFNIPWRLSANYVYRYTQSGVLDKVITQGITLNGDVSLTPKWKITFNTGYNLIEKVITASNFSINRNLHCWQMSMTLSPFGNYRTFFFTINAVSPLLQQLKLNKRAPTFIQ